MPQKVNNSFEHPKLSLQKILKQPKFPPHQCHERIFKETRGHENNQRIEKIIMFIKVLQASKQEASLPEDKVSV